MDAEIVAIANRQHGIVTHRQLCRLGLTRSAIEHRRSGGRLRKLHRGVYALGHDQLRSDGVWLAGVLAYGDDARLGAATGLMAWGLRDTLSVRVDVIVPTDAGISERRGTRLFRRPDLRSDECTWHHQIPITNVPRTLLDAAMVIEGYALRRATEQAFRRHGLTVAGLRRVLDAHPGRTGASALRALADDFEAFGVTFTRSDLEAIALELFLRAGVPRPHINRYHGGREIDCRWPGHDLVVEIDGWETHQGRAKFVADRARARRHVLRGERFLAYTHYDLIRRPEVVAGEIAQILAG